MSLYDAAKDAVKIAQKADNAELVKKLLDVQQQALDMQEKQFELNKKVEDQGKIITDLKTSKKYVYEAGHNWMIDPKNPEIKLCPVCLNRDSFENPLERAGSHPAYCRTCNRATS